MPKKKKPRGTIEPRASRVLGRVAGELLFLQPQGHVTLLHPFAGLAPVVLVVADFKGIRDG